jgi:hypothetical protein
VRNYKQGKVEIVEFASLDAMAEFAGQDGQGSGTHNHGRSWAGTDSHREAHELMVDGWAEIRPAVDSLMAEIRDRIADRTAPVFDMAHDVAGTFVDMAAFMAGEPACMVSAIPEPSTRSGKVVKILYNSVANAGVNAETMRKRGAVVLALVDALNVLGVNAEVWVETAVSYRGRKGSLLTCAKTAHEAVDVNRIMYALAHPSYLRRQGLSILAKTELVGVSPSNGGECAAANSHVAESFGADVSIVGDTGSDGRRMVAEGSDWVLDTLRGLGFDVRD